MYAASVIKQRELMRHWCECWIRFFLAKTQFESLVFMLRMGRRRKMIISWKRKIYERERNVAGWKKFYVGWNSHLRMTTGNFSVLTVWRFILRAAVRFFSIGARHRWMNFITRWREWNEIAKCAIPFDSLTTLAHDVLHARVKLSHLRFAGVRDICSLF